MPTHRRSMIAGVATDRTAGLDTLRAVLTILVVAHHSALAYFAYSSTSVDDTALTASPIADEAQSLPALYFVNLNDAFFMPLMFLLSGLFVPHSLARHGRRAFMRSRLLRLGVPLVAMATVIVPVAMLAAERAAGRRPRLWDHWRALFATGAFPVGPGWFLSLLLLFNKAASSVNVLGTPRARAKAGRLGAWLANPSTLLGVLIGLPAALYAPLLLVFGPNTWVGVGPVVIQASRPLFYAGYFTIGALLGAAELQSGTSGGSLAGLGACWLRFAAAAVPAADLLLSAPGEAANPPSWPSAVRTMAQGSAQTVFSAVMAVSLLGAAMRSGDRVARWSASLRANAYGIYVIHYAPVLWLQCGLRRLSIPALGKVAIVFAGALASSWGLVSALRRIPVIGRIL